MNSIILFITFLFVTAEGVARIKNGYSRQIQDARSALRSLKLQLTAGSDISALERRRLEADIHSLVSFISCYELTEELIARMKRISPAIFWDIENLKDRKGRVTDVYVKLVSSEKARLNLKAASFVSQSVGDADASCSEFGPFSVSIEVCITDNALFLLSHEFGHIKYIVPNLASYKQFYNKSYGRAKSFNVSYIGHGHQDQSGRTARKFEKIFREDRAIYKKNLGSGLQSFIGLYARLKKIHGDRETNRENALAHLF